MILGDEIEGIPPLVEESGLEVVTENPDLIMTYGGDGLLLGSEREWPGIPKLPLRNSRHGWGGRRWGRYHSLGSSGNHILGSGFQGEHSPAMRTTHPRGLRRNFGVRQEVLRRTAFALNDHVKNTFRRAGRVQGNPTLYMSLTCSLSPQRSQERTNPPTSIYHGRCNNYAKSAPSQPIALSPPSRFESARKSRHGCARGP